MSVSHLSVFLCLYSSFFLFFIFYYLFFFFFQAEDGIRDHCVTGVQTCALPIYLFPAAPRTAQTIASCPRRMQRSFHPDRLRCLKISTSFRRGRSFLRTCRPCQIGRASCRERV